MVEILTPLVVITLLILLNGIFVAAEFAIIGVPRASIERRAAEGQRAAQRVRSVLQDPRRQDRYIATAQLGITFASLGLGMYGEHVLAEWIAHWLEGLGTSRWITAHALASILAIAILTYFHIVVGEMVPKSLALMHAEGTALWITRPMLFIKTVFYPFVIGLNGLGNAILKVMGVERAISSGSYHTPEELQYIVQESQEGGLLRAEQGQMLRDLLAFGQRTAREAMVPRVHIDSIPLGATPEQLRATLIDTQRTRYPITTSDLDHITGVIHIKDILRLLRNGTSLEADDVRPIAYVPETMELNRVLEAMRNAHTQMVAVMDEHGGTAGVVTIEDLCVEVMGEIEEGNDEIAEVRPTSVDGEWLASGEARLDEVGDALDRVLDHPEVDTVSGLVLSILERPPKVGDAVTYQDVRFEVIEVEGHGVRECRVALVSSSSTEG